jgi:lipopolysaccharide/colanic/teichoic acid biosynthesis glycosyltransferase
MNFKELWKKTNPALRFQQTHTLIKIHSSKEFRTLLERERARSNRNGREFSVVVFYLDNLNHHNEELVHFIHVLTNRIRSTEEIGWLKENESIGIILPDTAFDGAKNLAHELCVLIKRSSTPPAHKVYSYPRHWFLDIHKGSHQSGEKKTASNLDSAKIQISKKSLNGLEPSLAPQIPVWKRIIDITGAFVGLILLSPVFLFIAILIKTVSPGPVFFKQERIGFLGRPFIFWKFRTMKTHTDPSLHQEHVSKLMNNGTPLTKLDEHDPRIIPFGKIMRKSGLDELPQLINVFRGEMSLIGPRPDLPYAIGQYMPWQKKREEALPGLTGLWQVKGKNRTTFNEMVRLDINYVEKRSFWLDLNILLHTVPAIIDQILEPSSKQE